MFLFSFHLFCSSLLVCSGFLLSPSLLHFSFFFSCLVHSWSVAFCFRFSLWPFLWSSSFKSGSKSCMWTWTGHRHQIWICCIATYIYICIIHIPKNLWSVCQWQIISYRILIGQSMNTGSNHRDRKEEQNTLDPFLAGQCLFLSYKLSTRCDLERSDRFLLTALINSST